MRIVPLAALVGIAAFATILGAPRSEAGDKDSIGETFQARCASCHTIPDPEIRTDMAWLDQVNRTS